MSRESRKKRQQEMREIIEEVGYDKAPAELCKSGYAASRAEARRYVRYLKIDNGDKVVRH